MNSLRPRLSADSDSRRTRLEIRTCVPHKLPGGAGWYWTHVGQLGQPRYSCRSLSYPPPMKTPVWGKIRLLWSPAWMVAFFTHPSVKEGPHLIIWPKQWSHCPALSAALSHRITFSSFPNYLKISFYCFIVFFWPAKGVCLFCLLLYPHNHKEHCLLYIVIE